MRQQYHHRKVGEDTHLWNVNKLVEMTKSFPVANIHLSDIKELDECFWYDDGNVPTCRSVAEHAKLIHETDLKYPILLCPNRKVIDGMHRVCKAYMQDMDTIKAVILPEMPEPDYKNVHLKDLPYDEE